MLYELSPANWSAYVNNPNIENGNLVFRSLMSPGPEGTLRNGVGAYYLPAYQPGETLQWAILARTPTPPAVLDLVVAVSGSVTNLAVYGLSIGSDWGWTISSPAVVDQYVSLLLAGIPDINKTIEIQKFLLGDPASIAQATGAGQPEIPGKKSSALPWVAGAIAVGLVIAVISTAKKGTGIMSNLPKR